MHKSSIYRVLFALIIIYILTLGVEASIPASERGALIALYKSTNGDNWTTNSGWKTPPLHSDGFALPGTENDWYGVDVSSDKVMQIVLDHNNLSGTLPAELKDLTRLYYFYLRGNNISGTIPAELGQLDNLFVLSLGENQLTGTIPPELGNLFKLGYLSLFTNGLTGSIPPELGNLSSLKSLSIYGNQLTGTIPPELGNLALLESLSIGYNGLTGTVPSELSALTRMKYFSLSDNSLTGTIPLWITNFVNLEHLSLGNNGFTGTIPPQLGNLSKLNTINLYSNRLEGGLPPELGNLTLLGYFSVSRNKLVGPIPSTYINLTNLGSNTTGFDYNGLYTDDETLRTFLSEKDAGWEETQTIAPVNLAVDASATSITLSWDPILYRRNTGGYNIYYSTSPTGPMTYYGKTSDKYASSMEITGLSAGTDYYFAVNTITNPHGSNNNTVISEMSPMVGTTPTIPVNTYQLSIQSTPFTGVGISVSPADNNGNGTGNTAFTCIYNEGTLVSVTAPSVYKTGRFSKWVKDGVDFDTNPSTQLIMDANHTLAAVYEKTYQLTVLSSPDPGVNVLVSPGDINGKGSGAATFSRTYAEGTTVTLTAPSQFNGQNFARWTVDGQEKTNLTIEVSMDAAHMAVVYYETAIPTYSLTVQSTPESGVDITVAPADRNGDGNGSTAFIRTYDEGTAVTLTAPGTHNGNGFLKWIVDGTDNVNPSLQLTMSTDHTLTAVYEETVPPGATYTLTVESTHSHGCPISISPADENGDSDGVTKLSRLYAEGTVVTLTAPAEYNQQKLDHWKVDGKKTSSSGKLQLTISRNHKAKAYYVTPSRPGLVVRPGKINFGLIIGEDLPPAQVMRVTLNGSSVDWSAKKDVDWLSMNPLSGYGSTEMTVSLTEEAALLGEGQYSGTITVTAPDADHSPQTVTVNLKVYGNQSTTEPIGEFSTPTEGATVYGSIPVTGWVIDDIGVESVKLYREGKNPKDLIYIGDAVFVEGARPDVEESFPDYPQNYQAGWGYMLLTNFFPDGGNGTFTIHAVAKDVEGNAVTLGTRTVTCDNANAVTPFGAIDTPGQGAVASGDGYINWGWVLTPQPNSIPPDGSTISVWVDGINIGNPKYNIYREDIAVFFPGLANSEGAVGYFYLDTTGYDEGIHSIQWVATDSGGNTDGIGSRYFVIQNGGQSHKTNSFNAQHSVTDAESLQEISKRTGRRIPQIIYDGHNPVTVKKGYNKHSALLTRYPDENGQLTIEINQLERLEIHLSGSALIEDVRDPQGRRPIGVTLDRRTGGFIWQPGPGFVGLYRFEVTARGPGERLVKKKINIRILPGG